uniref:Insulin-induced gene protein n=1 Tax=Monopterus albus TaxID=43700 RepID=A0A3Q3J5R4_MONAL
MSLTLTAMSNSTVTSSQQQWSRSGQAPLPSRGPYISVITNRTTNLVIRGAMLFSVGVFLALVLNLLQVQRNVTLFPPDVISSIFSSAWWVPLCCGTASAMIGLLYPCIDSHLGEPHKFKREWSSVMRCVAVFVGINHASAKVDFANNIQLSLTLAALSIGLWWTFDRSLSGFGLGVSIAMLATLATQLLVYKGVFQGATVSSVVCREAAALSTRQVMDAVSASIQLLTCVGVKLRCPPSTALAHIYSCIIDNFSTMFFGGLDQLEIMSVVINSKSYDMSLLKHYCWHGQDIYLYL